MKKNKTLIFVTFIYALISILWIGIGLPGLFSTTIIPFYLIIILSSLSIFIQSIAVYLILHLWRNANVK